MSPMLALPERPVYCGVPVVETKTGRPLLRLVGLASITVTFLAASAAPTPLYATYQKAWGFSALTTTVVFGIYAVAFLSALLTVGRLSDHVGRRPVLLAGIAGQILALVVFVDAHSVTALLAARIVQGLATGTAIGAIGAGMLDIDPVRGAVANATAPGLGTASGALLSAFAVQWLPAPTRLVYVVLAGLLLVQAFGVFLLPETSPRAPGAWRSLIPQIALPAQTRRPMLAAAPVLFAVWALAGFYGSLGPSLIDHLVGSASVVDGGLGLGILAGVAALTTYVLRATPAPRVMLIGTSALIVGVVAVLLSLWADSALGFFAGDRRRRSRLRRRLPGRHPPRRSPGPPRPASRGALRALHRLVSRPGHPRRRRRVGRRARRRPRRHQLRVRPGRDRPGRLRHRQPDPSPYPRTPIDPGGLPMTDTRPHKTPGPDHPITLERSPAHVVVRSGSVVIAETDRALEMREAAYPAVLYVPIDDVDQHHLRRSEHHTWCPYKGEASYYDIVDGDGTDLTAAVWYYDDPFPAVADIKGHVAFYADRVSVTATPSETALR